MTKNKVLNIKVIFKTYLKHKKHVKNILGYKQTFVLQISKSSFKDYSQKPFFKIIFENSY